MPHLARPPWPSLAGGLAVHATARHIDAAIGRGSSTRNRLRRIRLSGSQPPPTGSPWLPLPPAEDSRASGFPLPAKARLAPGEACHSPCIAFRPEASSAAGLFCFPLDGP